jgi:hypothetical protein
VLPPDRLADSAHTRPGLVPATDPVVATLRPLTGMSVLGRAACASPFGAGVYHSPPACRPESVPPH